MCIFNRRLKVKMTGIELTNINTALNISNNNSLQKERFPKLAENYKLDNN